MNVNVVDVFVHPGNHSMLIGGKRSAKFDAGIQLVQDKFVDYPPG